MGNRKLLAVWSESYLWKKNDIYIKFLSGTEISRYLVRYIFLHYFAPYVGLTFHFVEPNESPKEGDVNVMFDETLYTSSATSYGHNPCSEMRFNFDYTDRYFTETACTGCDRAKECKCTLAELSKKEKYRTVIHEIAHVMGMDHDFARDPWPQKDVDETIEKMLKDTPDFAQKSCTKPYTPDKCPRIYHNLMHREGAKMTNEKDPQSVMNWSYEKQAGIKESDIVDLSPMDKAWLREKYPPKGPYKPPNMMDPIEFGMRKYGLERYLQNRKDEKDVVEKDDHNESTDDSEEDAGMSTVAKFFLTLSSLALVCVAVYFIRRWRNQAYRRVPVRRRLRARSPRR